MKKAVSLLSRFAAVLRGCALRRNRESSSGCVQRLAADHGHGRLTDGKGRVVDFKNTIIIMTSNLGSSYLQAANLRTPEDFEKASEQVMNALHGHFRPNS